VVPARRTASPSSRHRLARGRSPRSSRGRRGARSDRPQRVYHLAAAGPRGPVVEHTAETLRVNVLGTHCLIEAIRILGDAPRILVTSSSTVYRPSTDALTETSAGRAAEPLRPQQARPGGPRARRVDERWVPTVIARAFNHVGPGQSAEYFTSSFARQVAAIRSRPGISQRSKLATSMPARDLTDVRDTVRAYVRADGARQPGNGLQRLLRTPLGGA